MREGYSFHGAASCIFMIFYFLRKVFSFLLSLLSPLDVMGYVTVYYRVVVERESALGLHFAATTLQTVYRQGLADECKGGESKTEKTFSCQELEKKETFTHSYAFLP